MQYISAASMPLPYGVGLSSNIYGFSTTGNKNHGSDSYSGLIGWCDFLPGGDQFASLNEEGKFQVWDTETLQARNTTQVEGGRWAAVDPTGEFIAVYTYNSIHWLDAVTLETVATHLVDESESVWIWDVHISKDRRTCLVVTYEHGAMVFDIENVGTMSKRLTYFMDGKIYSFASVQV